MTALGTVQRIDVGILWARPSCLLSSLPLVGEVPLLPPRSMPLRPGSPPAPDQEAAVNDRFSASIWRTYSPDC